MSVPSTVSMRMYQGQQIANAYGNLIYNVKDQKYGAKGDGVTDDTKAFQEVFNDVVEGGTVVIPPGVYYTDGAAVTGGTSFALSGAQNVHVIGYGATILQGPTSTRVLGIFYCSNVTIEGVKFIGNTYRTGDVTTERNCAISINFNSINITINNCYITNFLGDCVYVGGSLSSGGELGFTTKNITIKNCTLKERYGNGIRSYEGGSRSRTVIAVIDTIGVKIHNNDIYGYIDLEPNLSEQNIVSALIHDNNFLSGWVQPQSNIGKDYWYDEPLGSEGDPGAVEYLQKVQITGRQGSPIIRRNKVYNNTFENGLIEMANIYVFDVINNTFGKGLIEIGDVSGTNNTNGVLVEGNRANSPRDGENTFIKLTGNVSFSQFINNVCVVPSGYCITDDGPNTGDNGRNYFSGNINRSPAATGVISFVPRATSVTVGNWYNQNSPVERSRSDRMAVKEIINDLVSVTLTSSDQVIDYRTVGGNVWYIQGSGLSLSRVSNIPDGTKLTIISAGGVTIKYNSSYIRMNGAVDFVMASSNDNISFVSRSGILFETGRNKT